MAFKLENLSVLAYADGFTLWFYRTDDELSLLLDPGYWFDAMSRFREGDQIKFVAAYHAMGELAVAYHTADGIRVRKGWVA